MQGDAGIIHKFKTYTVMVESHLAVLGHPVPIFTSKNDAWAEVQLPI